MYCITFEEYVVYITLLDKCINDYRQMVGELPLDIEETKEEKIE